MPIGMPESFPRKWPAKDDLDAYYVQFEPVNHIETNGTCMDATIKLSEQGTQPLPKEFKIAYFCQESFQGRGIWKRIDENRQLLQVLHEQAPDFLKQYPRVVGWIAGIDAFFLGVKDLLALVKPQWMGERFPREWPALYSLKSVAHGTTASNHAALHQLKNFCNSQDIWMRIDENRALLDCFNEHLSELLQNWRCIESWLIGTDDFLITLTRLLELPAPAVDTYFPRSWRGSYSLQELEEAYRYHMPARWSSSGAPKCEEETGKD